MTMASCKLVLIFILTTIHLSRQCPDQCECYVNSYDWLVSNCSALDLDAVPKGIASNTTVLYIANNFITSIDQNTIGGSSSSLLLLYAHDNRIEKLKKTSFRGLFNLWYVNLSRNRIVSIHPKTFEGNQNLEFIYLDENPLTVVGGAPFLISMKSLVKLSLRGCEIIEISDKTFLGMENLKELDISENPITTLDSSMFSSLDQLEWLYLSDCNITTFQDEPFNELTQLKYLRLSGNELSSSTVIYLLNLEIVESLDLSFCGIRELAEDTPCTEVHFQYLNLSGNSLHSLNSISIDHLKDLNYFDISNNPLQCDCSSLHIREYLQKNEVKQFWPEYCVARESDGWVKKSWPEFEVTCASAATSPQAINMNTLLYIFLLTAGGFLLVAGIVFAFVRCRKSRWKFLCTGRKFNNKTHEIYEDVNFNVGFEKCKVHDEDEYDISG